MKQRSALLLLAIFGLAVSIVSAQRPAALTVSGDVAGAHDPSMIREGSTWYVFTTGKAADGGQLGVRCSEDLNLWRHCGHVFDAIPQWIQQRSPETKDLWAPDISFEHGEYRMYYAYSEFGKNTSGIALATNVTLDPKSPDYRWTDKGLILESTVADNFNAIDANYVEDADGRAWLDFGSFWSGIKLRALDATTGRLSGTDVQTYALASRGRTGGTDPHAPALPPDTQAVEAPFVVHHGGFYYLFVSFDLCCRGTRSTYRTMVGRSRQITGPYLDRAGVPMSQGSGLQLLTANDAWLGPGGASVILGHGTTPDLLVYHAYDRTAGKPSLHLSTIVWHGDWPEVALRH